MKLVQFRLKREEKSAPRTGALIAGGKAILDLAATLDGPHGKGGWLPAHTSCEWYNVDGSVWSLVRSACEVALGADDKTVAQWMKQGRVVALEDARLTAPVPRPGKLICIGLNYRDHALEQNAPIPESPIVFSKFTTAIIGPEDQVVVPAACTQPDYEAELAVVIGRTARTSAASTPTSTSSATAPSTTSAGATSSSPTSSGSGASPATPSRRWGRSWPRARRSRTRTPSASSCASTAR